jgi:DNA-binding LacI/PurR family transcriptional regulator
MEKVIRCATRKDVAKRAGVSVTVVSYVLNNNRSVDSVKRQRVLDAVKELNYTPNNVARALKGKSSKHIIFLVDSTSDEQFSRLLVEMDKFAAKKGYIISLCANRDSEEFVRQMILRRVDGIIINSLSFPEDLVQDFVEAQIPVVVFMSRQYLNSFNVARIGAGLYHGTRDSVRLFTTKGKRHIIYVDRISTDGYFSGSDDNRYRGYVDEMKDQGLEDEIHLVSGGTSVVEFKAILKQYIETHPVEGILGRNDYVACLSIKIIKEMGLSVPEDILVIGYDDSSLCEVSSPSLSSVKMQEELIAKQAIDYILTMHTKKIVPAEIRFDAELVLRESTGS